MRKNFSEVNVGRVFYKSWPKKRVLSVVKAHDWESGWVEGSFWWQHCPQKKDSSQSLCHTSVAYWYDKNVWRGVLRAPSQSSDTEIQLIPTKMAHSTPHFISSYVAKSSGLEHMSICSLITLTKETMSGLFLHHWAARKGEKHTRISICFLRVKANLNSISTRLFQSVKLQY